MFGPCAAAFADTMLSAVRSRDKARPQIVIKQVYLWKTERKSEKVVMQFVCNFVKMTVKIYK
jgi:hypothetical protein